MKIENRFVVAAPIDTVWASITDPEIVAPCIPGCEDVEVLSPTAYKAKMKIAIGPIKASFNLDIEVTNQTLFEELISGLSQYVNDGVMEFPSACHLVTATT